MPIKFPSKPQETKDPDEPKKPKWSERAFRVVTDMSHTRGANRQELRADSRDPKRRVETVNVNGETRVFTSSPTKPPASEVREKRRDRNKEARRARKRNR